jgi:hypothetical protein
MTKSKKILYASLSAAILAIIVLLAMFPERYAKCCLSGLELWLYFVLPSLFPFFVLTALLTKLGVAERASRVLSPLCEKAFKMPGIASYCFAMSALSGYPVGSRMLADLRENGLITDAQATRMSPLCSTSGPLFVIASVGAAMFHSQKIGLILFCSHIFAVVLVCLVFSAFTKKQPAAQPPQRRLVAADNILYESVYGAVTSILVVGAFIAVFYILAQILSDFYLLLPAESLFSLVLSPFDKSGQLAAAFTQGLIEATHGCKLLAQNPGMLSVSLAAFVITFGGVSILAQQICYFKKAGVKLKYFLPVKIMQAFTAFALCLLFCFLFQ